MDGMIHITANIDPEVYERMADLIVPILSEKGATLSHEIKLPKETYMVKNGDENEYRLTLTPKPGSSSEQTDWTLGQ